MFGLPNLWVIGGVALLTLSAGFGLGYKLAVSKYDKLLIETQQRDMAIIQQRTEQLNKEIAKSAQLSRAYQASLSTLQRKQKVIIKEVVREIEKPVYRCELPDTGRVLITEAIASANSRSDTPAGPDAVVPIDPNPPPP